MATKRKRMRKPHKSSKKFDTKEKIILLFSVALIVFGMYAIFFRPDTDVLEMIPPVEVGDLFVLLPELQTNDYSMVSIDVAYDNKNGIISLTSGCKQIIAYVEQAQAESIYRGINDIMIARPNSHDMMVDTLENFDIEVVMVKVTELKENSFYGRIILKKDNKILSLDARPSDATAVAVRTNAPIYVKTDLLETQGEDVC